MFFFFIVLKSYVFAGDIPNFFSIDEKSGQLYKTAALVNDSFDSVIDIMVSNIICRN